jgi:hypothetical protein
MLKKLKKYLRPSAEISQNDFKTGTNNDKNKQKGLRI